MILPRHETPIVVVTHTNQVMVSVLVMSDHGYLVWYRDCTQAGASVGNRYPTPDMLKSWAKSRLVYVRGIAAWSDHLPLGVSIQAWAVAPRSEKSRSALCKRESGCSATTKPLRWLECSASECRSMRLSNYVPELVHSY